MARINTIGFGLNSLTTNKEMTAMSGSPAISTSVLLANSYTLHTTSLSSGTPKYAAYHWNLRIRNLL